MHRFNAFGKGTRKLYHLNVKIKFRFFFSLLLANNSTRRDIFFDAGLNVVVPRVTKFYEKKSFRNKIVLCDKLCFESKQF